MRAYKEGHMDVVKLLVDTDADIGEETRLGAVHRSLVWADENGHDELCKLLREEEAKIIEDGINSSEAIKMAEEKGHTEIAKLLRGGPKN
jgi:ankyrin repeat protein